MLLFSIFAQQSEILEKEKIDIKVKEEELRKSFHTLVSLCVLKGHMSTERAHSFYRSGEKHAAGLCERVLKCN